MSDVDVHIITPPTASLPLGHILVAITEELDRRDPELVAHGVLGGTHGYGGDWDSDVFAMRPYYWGDCDCGGEQREDEWHAANSHTSDCYQTELQRRVRAAGLSYWDDVASEWVNLRKFKYDEEQEIKDRIYRAMCEEYQQPYPSRCAVHCTCGHDEKFTAWVTDNGHTPKCSLVLPNFHYKAAGLEVRWYKWIGRSMETNGVVVDLSAMLKECLSDIHKAPHGAPTPTP